MPAAAVSGLVWHNESLMPVRPPSSSRFNRERLRSTRTQWKGPHPTRQACPLCRATVTPWGLDPPTYRCDVCKTEHAEADLVRVPDVALRDPSGYDWYKR